MTVVLLACLIGQPALAGDWQPLASIAATAEAHARSSLGGGGAVRVESQVKALDNRLKLARCDQPLQAFSPPGTEMRQNVVVGVRCRGSNPWQIYVPVRISAVRSVLVTSRPLARGAILSARDVRTEQVDVSALRTAYLTDAAQLQGKVLKRPLPEGRVLTMDALNDEEVIRRGQRVTLMVTQDGFRVQMAGTALMDGAVNERIRVENHSSRRTVEGIVRSAKLVEVIAY
ncbi:MAG: flagellar basal body P-ring formation chaperone FlgA [Pseudomonadales bacterium]